jgi:hypothetical protein
VFEVTLQLNTQHEDGLICLDCPVMITASRSLTAQIIAISWLMSLRKKIFCYPQVCGRCPGRHQAAHVYSVTRRDRGNAKQHRRQLEESPRRTTRRLLEANLGSSWLSLCWRLCYIAFPPSLFVRFCICLHPSLSLSLCILYMLLTAWGVPAVCDSPAPNTSNLSVPGYVLLRVC